MLNQNAISDLQLIEKVKNGDMQSLALLYQRYFKPLIISARTQSPDREAADNAVMDVLLSLLNKDDQRPITNVKAYLHQAVRYRCRSVHNAAMKEAALYDQYHRLYPDYVLPTNRMEMAELQAALRAALNLLPAQMKKAIELSYLEEKEREEVASALGVSPATVTKYISEALKRLATNDSLKAFQS